MNTRDSIIKTADHFIRRDGFNAFSFKDISNKIGIKTSSIHYHFPTKTDLAVATVDEHIRLFEQFDVDTKHKSPQLKLKLFLDTYSELKAQDKICIVGSLSTDLKSLDKKVEKELRLFSEMVLNWVANILKEGKVKKQFFFDGLPRTKAIMIITNMLAIVQLSRITKFEDVEIVKKTIINELKKRK